MNILYLYEMPFIDGFGGTETYLRQMVYGLKERGHNPIVVYPIFNSEEKHLLSGIECCPLLIEGNNSYQGKVLDFIKSLERNLPSIVSKYKVDCVHLTFGWYLLSKLDYTFFKTHRIKVVATIHNVPPQEHSYTFPGDKISHRINGLIKYFGRVVLSLIDIIRLDRYVEVIVPCENVRKRLRRYGCRNIIHIINHGYNNQIDFAESRKEKEHQNRKFEILCVAGVARGKNQQLLIDVMAKIHNKEQYTVHLVGNIKRCYGYYLYLQDKIKRENLNNIFVFHPSCPNEELDLLYRTCDLYVQPSKDEGFCLSALDAAAYGMPVIGSDVGEIANIAKLSGGKVVRFNDRKDFRKAIEFYYNDRSQIINNSCVIRRQYNWNKSLAELISVFSDVNL